MSSAKHLDMLSDSLRPEVVLPTLVSDGGVEADNRSLRLEAQQPTPLPLRPRKQPPPPTGDKRTTLMIKNLPNRYTRAMVIGLFESRLPPGSIDFVYVPIQFHTRQNFAYAFVNLSSPSLVKAFFAHFHGLPYPGDPRAPASKTPSPVMKSKTCEVVFARVQGIEANVNRLINSPILTACSQADSNDTALPLVYQNGESVRFSELLLTAVRRENTLLAWSPAPGNKAGARARPQSASSPASSPVLTPNALSSCSGDKAESASWITESLIKEMMALLDPSGSPPLSATPPIYYDLQLPQ